MTEIGGLEAALRPMRSIPREPIRGSHGAGRIAPRAYQEVRRDPSGAPGRGCQRDPEMEASFGMARVGDRRWLTIALQQHLYLPAAGAGS